MPQYRNPDPIDISCEHCKCLYTLIRAWKEPAAAQSLKCKECGHVVWSNDAGHRHNANTGQEYMASGEYQGFLLPKSRTPESVQSQCEHEYKKERIMGNQTGDWVCVKCGYISLSRPD